MSTPLDRIATESGRVSQLELGVGNNQPARASDVNPIIDYVNARAAANKGTVTQGTSITTGVTLNSAIGTITTVSSTLAAGAEAAFVVTNSKVTSSSVILTSMNYASAATGIPIVESVIPATGSFTIIVANVDAAAALNAVMAISFVVL